MLKCKPKDVYVDRTVLKNIKLVILQMQYLHLDMKKWNINYDIFIKTEIIRLTISIAIIRGIRYNTGTRFQVYILRETHLALF